MRTTWNFNTAGQVVFGQNAIDELGDRTQQMGAHIEPAVVWVDAVHCCLRPLW